jgi:hypothetical protein
MSTDLAALEKLSLFEAPEATLPSLPTEIFEQVAEYLPEEDLPALRLVCRDACSKTQRIFIAAHFSYKAVLLDSPSSITALTKIARHASFGPSLRRITLLVDKIGYPKDLKTPYKPLDYEGHKMLVKLRFRLWDDHKPFLSPSIRRQALDMLFGALKTPEKVHSITFTQTCKAEQPSLKPLKPVFDGTAVGRLSESRLGITEEYVLNKRLEPTCLVSMVLEAFNNAGLESVKEIHMKNMTALELERDMSFHTIHVLKHAFHGLKSLSVSAARVEHDGDHATMLGYIPNYAPHFYKAIAQAPLLENRKIDTVAGYHPLWLETEGDSLDDWSPMDEFLKQTLPSLQSLHLVGPGVDMGRLLTFLRRHKSLSSLRLTCVTLDWETYFGFVDRNEPVRDALMRLTHLEDVVTESGTEELIQYWWTEMN